MSTLAVFVALGGTTLAVSLPRKSVGPKQQKNNAVREKKIKDAAVSERKLADAAVTSGKLAGASVTSGAIAGGAVATEELANASVPCVQGRRCEDRSSSAPVRWTRATT